MRNIKKCIDEYNKKFGNNFGRGKIYASDLQQIMALSCDIYDYMIIALKVGYIAGYKLGKKESKKK